MESVVLLVNFNDYLGGGETLLVRYALYLQNNKISFKIFCLKHSFIYNELIKQGIDIEKIYILDQNPDFYYLTSYKKALFIEKLSNHIKNEKKQLRFLTFCLRDLYTITELVKSYPNSSITHLVLHVNDYLYLGQSLWDKFLYKRKRIVHYSNVKIIEFNKRLLKFIHNRNGLISMAQIINDFWAKEFALQVSQDKIIPLPSFQDLNLDARNESLNKKIIWIGRIVDFKIPSLLAMIDFIATSDYKLTIIGKGEIDVVKKYILDNKIDMSKFCFLGEVDYSNLGSIISQHSIGYAMGTSLIELAKYKIPVIVALASFTHVNFERQICGGLFYDKELGCDGSDLLLTEQKNIKTIIKDCILEIENNYSGIAQKCYQYAKENYSESINFFKYTQIILNTLPVDKDVKKNIIPRVPKIRKLMYMLFK